MGRNKFECTPEPNRFQIGRVPPADMVAGLRDIDGNLYTSVIIGSQEWLVENLIVTKYANREPIPFIYDNTLWAAASAGAVAYYNNDGFYHSTYGLLYNGFVIDDPRGISHIRRDGVHEPDWRMPTLADFTALDATLSPSPADKLKEAGDEHWLSPIQQPNNGNNLSGFTALGGSARSANGSYVAIKSYAFFWGDVVDANNANCMYLIYSSFAIHTAPIDRNLGCSIRLVRDIVVP